MRRHADFQRIQSGPGQAGRVMAPHFVFLVARTAGWATPDRTRPSQTRPSHTGPSRIGLVVTKKIGNAVVRSRIKRLCRETFRLAPMLLPAGVDLVVIARRGAETLGLAEVQAEWERAAGALRHRARQALAQPASQPHDAPQVAPPRGATPPARC